MISFRYHLVSLVAIFLALAIGITAGSTVIKESVVDNLRANVDSVNKRLNEVEKRDKDLTAEVNGLHQLDKGLGDEGARQFLANRLAAPAVLLVSVEGVDGDTLTALRSDLKVAGARLAANVRLNAKLALATPDDAKSLGEVMKTAPTADVARGALVDHLEGLLQKAAIPAADGASTVSTTVPAPTGLGPVMTMLAELDKRGFVSMSSIDDDLTTLVGPLRLVVVSGAGAKIDDTKIIMPLLRKLADAGRPVVLAAEATAGSAVVRGSFVSSIRADIGLRGRIGTVDDLETFAGRAAVVLSIADLDQGHVGHYGVGADAERLLPVPTTVP